MNTIQQQLSKINALKLYHIDIYLPQHLIEQVLTIMQSDNFIFSKHLRDGINRDYKHEITLQNVDKYVKLMKRHNIYPFEVETQFDAITKFCIRWSDDNGYDVVLAFAPIENGVLVKTCWRNHFKDLHISLDRSKYEIKEGE